VIPDEPVRGHTPPPWFRALNGIDSARAFSRGLLPRPPLARLLGQRTTHVAAGTVTVVVPASDACITSNGQLEIVPPMIAALEMASGTALPAGMDVVPMRFTFKAFRPARPGNGNLRARAHVLNDSNLFVFAEVQVEDPDGRHIGQGSLHSMVLQVEPAPPSPPKVMSRLEEPVYETPDPYLRSVPIVLLTGETGSENTAAGFAAGVTDYLTKPFKPPFVRARVRAWLVRGSAPSATDA